MLEEKLEGYFQEYLARHSVKNVSRVAEILFDEIDYQMWCLLCEDNGSRFEKILKEEM